MPTTHAISTVRPAATALLAVALAVTAAAGQEADKPAPPVTVEAVLVSPPDPGPDTLCRLAVVLKNRSDKSVSGFGFQVTVNGNDLPVYGKQRYLEALDAGESREIALFNFWSSETLRPAAKDGSLTVEVALVEARWVSYELEDDVPTWTLLDEVKGLPSSAKVSKPFRKGPSAN